MTRNVNLHNLNRQKVCLICFQKDTRSNKTTYRKIWPESKLEEMINLYFPYNAHDERLPNALCDKCRRKLYHVKNGREVRIDHPDLNQFREGRLTTRLRSNEPCACKICEIVGATLFRKEDGRFRKMTTRSKVNAGQYKPKPKLHKIMCGKCYLWIERGKDHNCRRVNRLKNVTKIITSLPKTEKAISTLLKAKLAERASDQDSGEIALRGGRATRISINAQQTKNSTSGEHIVSVNDVVDMKSTLGASQRKILKMTSIMRNRLQNRKLFEPNMKQKLSAHLHSLDTFFEHTTVDFTVVKGKKISHVKRDVTFCKDLSGLINYVKEKRNKSHVHLKFGIDAVGGFLKLCLSIQSIDNDSITKRSRHTYKDETAAKTFLDTGVKKLLVIGLAQGVQENFENVSKLWSLINIDSVSMYTIAVDLKLANILAGLMAHSCLHPCTWCMVKKDQLEDCGELRTIGNITDNCLLWLKSGGNMITAKNYYNCVNKPVFTGDDDKTILDIIPPPELHLMLGVVNSMYNHLLKESNEVALSWAHSCHVERDITNGGSSFNGNSCKTLLNKVDLLRSICPISCLKYVQAFDDFRIVVDSCFGNNLDLDYKSCINKFKQSYLDLKIPVTPKVHCVFHHVAEFCDTHHKALGFYGEQAMEAVHFQFKSTWLKLKVHENHPQYPRHLLRAICDFNSHNV